MVCFDVFTDLELEVPKKKKKKKKPLSIINMICFLSLWLGIQHIYANEKQIIICIQVQYAIHCSHLKQIIHSWLNRSLRPVLPVRFASKILAILNSCLKLSRSFNLKLQKVHTQRSFPMKKTYLRFRSVTVLGKSIKQLE